MNLRPCPVCARHIEASEVKCPFCAAEVSGPPLAVPLVGPDDLRPAVRYGAPPDFDVRLAPMYGGPPIPARGISVKTVVAIVLLALIAGAVIAALRH